MASWLPSAPRVAAALVRSTSDPDLSWMSAMASWSA